MRAGATALSLLAAPLNVHILQTLEQEPKTLLDLRQAIGSPPQSTMRLYSRTLAEHGVIERSRRNEFQASVLYQLTPAGRDLLRVAGQLEDWLTISATGAISLGTTGSKSATKALVEGWSTNIVRAIAARPLSLTELNKVIPKVSYPSLERRLGSMRLAGLVEAQPGERRGTPYGATDWLRRGIVPVAAAAAWERKYRQAESQPIGRLGVEAAFLLTVPLLEMPVDYFARCRLAVEVKGGSSPVFAGIIVAFAEGKVTSCSSRLEGGEVEAWASGSPDAWLRRMSGSDRAGLGIGGDSSLVEALLDGFARVGAKPLDPDPV
jgi:DNA-binding HxlR family transcriptional regulator